MLGFVVAITVVFFGAFGGVLMGGARCPFWGWGFFVLFLGGEGGGGLVANIDGRVLHRGIHMLYAVVCWLLEIPARNRVYPRDGSAQKILLAVTLRQRTHMDQNLVSAL